MGKLTLRDLPLHDQRVLMRVDFNVPIHQGTITDDSRIRAALPSIRYVLDHGGSLVLMSHLGRPKKKDPSLSLAPCAQRLEELLKTPVIFAPDCRGPAIEEMTKKLRPGQTLVLENLRFYEAEEDPEKNPSFAQEIAKLGDYYVNDAFGTAHRAHTSTATITRFFPNRAAMGFLMEKEIQALSPLLTHPKHPFMALIGDAKVSSKIGILKRFSTLVDTLFIGGAMAFTFLKGLITPPLR